jgi:GAF domain-containing protein
MARRAKAAGTRSTQSKRVKRPTSRKRPTVRVGTARKTSAVKRELAEAIHQHTVSTEILRLIGQTTFDLQNVLDRLTETAARLSKADMASICRQDGAAFYHVTNHGFPADWIDYTKSFSLEAGRGSMVGRALMDGAVVQVADVLADPEYAFPEPQRKAGYRTFLAAPLLCDGRAIGVLSLCRKTVKPFSDKQIALIQGFAAQAVIAIENARLIGELRRRTDDLSEALQQQTATAEVLHVISSSPGDLQPVFEAVLENATRICDARFGNLFQREGSCFRSMMIHGEPVYADSWRHDPVLDVRTNPDVPLARLMRSGDVVHITDLREEAGNQGNPRMVALIDGAGARTLLAVPMMKEGELVGAIAIYRQSVRPFSDKQIELVRNFAAQAVIAIENTRLLNELRGRTNDLSEALDQQTAIGDILRAISNSPGDIEPVFKTVVERAARICEATIVDIFTIDGDTLRVAESVGEFGRPLQEGIPLDRNTVIGRSISDKVPVHVADLLDGEHDFPAGRELAKRYGHRTILAVPLIRENQALGGILVRRTEARPFENKHVALLTTFADQAAIAIENARLVEELRHRTDDLSEALQQQTATADVLKVISRSAFDLHAVLDTLVRSAARLCEADYAMIFRRDGESFRLGISHGFSPDYRKWMESQSIAIGRQTLVGRVAVERRTVHIPDAVADAEYSWTESIKRGGFRTMLGVPLMREGEPIGVIALCRSTVLPFNSRQIELVTTFADQALIAIENVRLFDEVKTRTEDLRESLQQQTATADVLKVISRWASNLDDVFERLLSTAASLCSADNAYIYLLQGTSYRLAACSGFPSEYEEFLKQRAITPGRDTLVARTALERHIVHIPDVLADPEYTYVEAQRRGGFRTLLGIPMLREGKPMGVLSLSRSTVNPFTEKQIRLVETFADQAVIAIENARLFDEVQARTEDLRESLQQQTATADVLKVISRSAFDLQTVLQTLVESAARLSEADSATITRQENGVFYRSETFGFSKEFHDAIRTMPVVPERSSVAGRALLEGKVVHIPDILDDPEYTFTRTVGLDQFRTTLGVPMLRDGAPIGVMTLTRTEVRPFTEKQIDLVSTFADQAAIAIANSRLFEEVQQRTRELSKSLDDLRAAQDRLIQTEKLASLGQLTAGIAHEIKNPLNFVNNFAALSGELIDELNQVLKPTLIDERTREDVDELTRTLRGNLERVVQHGKRADSIVKNMLLHSRQGSGEQRPADINAVVEESLNLAYHGARAERPGFNITLRRDLDPAAGMIEIYPQEITRVFLNLFSNGFYAATKRKEAADASFEPMLSATTRSRGNSVEIRIRDNGTGIPPSVREQIFNPFFTTKPAGEGTGLGLSMSHDIIVKQHGGRIDVESKPDEFTEFIITLPRASAAQPKAGGAT